MNRLFALQSGVVSSVMYGARRFVASLPVLFMVTLVSFLMIRAIPGGPFVSSGERAVPQEVIQALERYYGLDRPLLLNLPGDPDWSLLHYVDEEVSERILALRLPAELSAVMGEVAGEVVRSYLDSQFDDRLQRIAFYNEQGSKAEEFPSLVDDLDAIATSIMATQPGLATQINEAVADARERDVSQITSMPAIRTSTRLVLYSDLFQSQFGNYLFNALRLDFGPSLGIASRGRSVSEIIVDKLPISIALGIMAVTAAMCIGLPLGVLAAVHHNRPVDNVAMFFAVVGRAVPNIVLGPVLIIFFAVKLKLFPVVNPYVWIDGPMADIGTYVATAFLPTITLGMGMSATIARLTRASLLQVLNEDYIRTARAKGLRERVVVYGHALRNSLIPVVTVLGPLLAAVLTGTFVVELVFAIPGLGNTFVTSVTTRDYNLLVGVTVIYATFLIVANIVVDIIYTLLDPRIRY